MKTVIQRQNWVMIITNWLELGAFMADTFPGFSWTEVDGFRSVRSGIETLNEARLFFTPSGPEGTLIMFMRPRSVFVEIHTRRLTTRHLNLSRTCCLQHILARARAVPRERKMITLSVRDVARAIGIALGDD